MSTERISADSAGSEDAGSLRFVTKVFSEAFDLLYGSQYIGAWTVDDIDSWTRRVGKFCSQYEHVARAGQRIRAELAAAHDKAAGESDESSLLAALERDKMWHARIAVRAMELVNHRTVSEDGFSLDCAMCENNAPCDVYGDLWRSLREAIASAGDKAVGEHTGSCLGGEQHQYPVMGESHACRFCGQEPPEGFLRDLLAAHDERSETPGGQR